jgi:hypothetical protein
MILNIDKVQMLDFKDKDGVGELTSEIFKVAVLDFLQVL